MKMKQRSFCKTIPVILTIANSLLLEANAATILGIASVASPQGSYPGLPLSRMIDQSLLSQNYTPGQTDFGSYVSSTSHGSGGGFTNLEDFGPQQFTFDLGAVSILESAAVWNTGFGVGAATRIQIYSDVDDDFLNGTTELLVSDSNIYTGTGLQFAQVFVFNPVNTQFVHINVLETRNPPDFFGLGEVVFGGAIPEPSCAILICFGFLGTLLSRRRISVEQGVGDQQATRSGSGAPG